jgi:hypothetical protein
MVCQSVDWIKMVWDCAHWRKFVNIVCDLGLNRGREFLDWLNK